MDDQEELSGNEKFIRAGQYNQVRVNLKYSKKLLDEATENCKGLGLDPSQAYSAIYWKTLHARLGAGLRQRGKVKDDIKDLMKKYDISISELER